MVTVVHLKWREQQIYRASTHYCELEAELEAELASDVIVSPVSLKVHAPQISVMSSVDHASDCQ